MIRIPLLGRLGWKRFVLFGSCVIPILAGSGWITDWMLEIARLESAGLLRDLVHAFTVIMVTMLLVVAGNIYALVRERRLRKSGSVIRTRLTVSFLLVTFIPVLMLGGVIAFIMSTGIQAVYRPEVEAALNQTIRLLRAQNEEERNLLLVRAKRELLANQGLFQHQNPPASGILFLGRRVYGSVRPPWLDARIHALLEEKPDRADLVPVLHQGRIAYLYRRPAGAALEFALVDPSGEAGAISAQVLAALGKYRQLRVLKEPLAAALVYLTLFAVLLSTLLVLFFSLRISRSITRPLSDLGEATRRVAQGDLMYRVTYPKSDAVGFLVDNFNQMTDELLSSREKLYNAQRLAAWQEVARRLAHEIKNPLTPIRLSAERLLRHARRSGADVLPLIEKMIPTILGEVQVIEELVNEFSSFARLPELRLERVDAVAFFREVVVSYHGTQEDSPLRYNSVPAELMCLLDKTQMRRAVSNLLQNALRAIAGRADGLIQVKLDRLPAGLVLSVTDNGTGIPEEIRGNIFQPYFTASEGGTGLGLPIVEKIVLEHGGRIHFRSVTGAGSTFYIELPTGEKS